MEHAQTRPCSHSGASSLPRAKGMITMLRRMQPPDDSRARSCHAKKFVLLLKGSRGLTYSRGDGHRMKLGTLAASVDRPPGALPPPLAPSLHSPTRATGGEGTTAESRRVAHAARSTSIPVPIPFGRRDAPTECDARPSAARRLARAQVSLSPCASRRRTRSRSPPRARRRTRSPRARRGARPSRWRLLARSPTPRSSCRRAR